MGYDQSSLIQFFTMFMFLVGGGKGDLLDYVSTQGFWSAKSVEVSPEAMLRELGPGGPGGGAAPNLKRQIENLGSEFDKIREAAAAEIAGVGAAALPQLEEAAQSANQTQADEARRLIDKIKSGGDAGPVRRLMAIRTLGELRHKAALPALTKLAESKQPFVGTYARRAIAAINGGAVATDASLRGKFESDVMMLPASVGIIGQYRVDAMKQLSLDELAKFGGRRLPPNAEDRRNLIEAKLIEIVEKSGNARLDGITIGVAEGMNTHDGFIVLIARGEFDSQVVGSVAKAVRLGEPDSTAKFPLYRQPGGSGVVMAPTSDCIIGFFGDRKQAATADAMVAAAQTGKGTLSDNKELAAMVQAADKSGPIWGVAKVSDAHRTWFPTGVLNGVESGVLTSAVKDGKVQLSLRATATDADKAGAAFTAFDAMWKNFLGEGQRTMAREPQIAPLVEVLQGLQYKADGAKLNLDATTADLTPGRFILPIFINEMRLRPQAGTTQPAAGTTEFRARQEAMERAAFERQAAEQWRVAKQARDAAAAEKAQAEKAAAEAAARAKAAQQGK